MTPTLRQIETVLEHLATAPIQQRRQNYNIALHTDLDVGLVDEILAELSGDGRIIRTSHGGKGHAWETIKT